MISLGVKHTHNIEEKANGKMELLRTISTFGATSWDEMTKIYILYIRSLLEQSRTICNSRLTMENIQDLEMVKKSSRVLQILSKCNKRLESRNISGYKRSSMSKVY